MRLIDKGVGSCVGTSVILNSTKHTANETLISSSFVEQTRIDKENKLVVLTEKSCKHRFRFACLKKLSIEWRAHKQQSQLWEGETNQTCVEFVILLRATWNRCHWEWFKKKIAIWSIPFTYFPRFSIISTSILAFCPSSTFLFLVKKYFFFEFVFGFTKSEGGNIFITTLIESSSDFESFHLQVQPEWTLLLKNSIT